MIELSSIPHQGALASAIVGHLVGDYLLQNDWMALNKKKSSLPEVDEFWERPVLQTFVWMFRWVSLPCLLHCFIWSISVMGFAGWRGNHDGWKWVTVFCVLFVTHYIQDRTQSVVWVMRETGQSKFIEPPLGPWSIIVVDNVWHILTIWVVWRFVA